MKIRLLSGIAILGLAASSLVFAADTMTDAQKKQVEGVVHDYLVKNPEVLVESFQVLQQRQMEQAQKTIQKTQDAAPKNVADLFHNTNDPVVGNPAGKITLVEFFDYQCPHCTAMESEMENVVKDNPNLRIVYKEFPIRGPMSDTAAHAALAAKIQGKYSEFHNALMKAGQSLLTEEIIYKVAKETGLDVDKLKKDMKDKTVDDQIKSNLKLGQSLQLLGTPAFFLAMSDIKDGAPAKAILFVPGQIPQDQLELAIKQVGK